MRVLSASAVTAAIEKMCWEANTVLPGDVACALESMREEETWPIAQQTLDIIIQNQQIARQENVPICQDTGMACVFLEVGQDLHIEGDLYQAVQEGVRKGYAQMRKSVVSDPLFRENSRDNTPAVITCDLVAGDKLSIIVAPKGFGSENMSRLAMLKPSDGVEGVKQFVVDSVQNAGPNPCPPIVVGVGVGGTFDRVALMAKRALLREIGTPNPQPYYAALEKELLEAINALGIGPQGYGGRTTALAVHIETYPTHIAGLPVAVNINCHVTRHVRVCL